MRIALTASLLLTPLESIRQPIVVLEDGRITEVTSRERSSLPGNARVVDFPEAILAPGFVDIHIHGGAGYDVMQADPDALPAIERQLARHGITSYFPTTVTAPLDATLKSLDTLAAAIQAAQRWPSDELRAQPMGLHLEGPFISHAKRGVHPSEHLLAPSCEVFERLHRAARGHVSLMTVAPELPDAPDLIVEAARRGITCSLGHSDSALEPAQVAIAAGARHATHTFNAMRPLDHRDPGILAAVLADERLTADIIADGVHVHPAVVELFLRTKGRERAVLISDAISATGMGDGRYRLGQFEVEVQGERCLHQDRLAGSVLTLDRAVRNVMQFARWELADTLPLATVNPARVVGIEKKGIIAPGADADIVVLTPGGEVLKTIARGVGV